MRTLNPLEETFLRVDRETPLNFTICAHIHGDLSLDLLRASVALQLRRYPALSWTMVQDESGFHWHQTQAAPRIDIVSGGAWQSAIAQTVNVPFSAGTDPAMRIRWIRSGEESRILVTFNHCLLDGRSGGMVVRTLLGDAVAMSRGEAPVVAHGYPLHPGLQDIGQTGRKTPLLPRKVVRFGTLNGKRHTAVLPIELNEQESQALLGNARRQGVSTTAVISAAHLLALTDIDESGPLSLSLPIDWRGRLDQISPDAFGLLIGNAHLAYRLRVGDDPWALARRLMGDFRSALNQAQPIVAPQVALDPVAVYASRASTAVSNIGTVEVDDEGGAFRVQSICFAVGCSYFGDQIVTAARSGGRISLMYCVTTDSVTVSRAQEIAAQTVEHLNHMMT